MRLDHITPKDFAAERDISRPPPSAPPPIRAQATTRLPAPAALPGGHSEPEPPDPIPNSEVKRLSADDSVGLPHAKVGHCQVLIPNAPVISMAGALFWGMGKPVPMGRLHCGPPWRTTESTLAPARPSSPVVRRAAFVRWTNGRGSPPCESRSLPGSNPQRPRHLHGGGFVLGHGKARAHGATALRPSLAHHRVDSGPSPAFLAGRSPRCVCPLDKRSWLTPMRK